MKSEPDKKALVSSDLFARVDIVILYAIGLLILFLCMVILIWCLVKKYIVRMVLSRKLKLPKIKKEDDIPMTHTANTSELTTNNNKNEENKPMLSKNITLENEVQQNGPHQAKTSKNILKMVGKIGQMYNEKN